MGTPGGETGGDGLRDVLFVGGVGGRGGVGVRWGEGSDFDSDGGAGEVIERPEGGTAEDDGKFGTLEGEADLVSKGEALGD